MRKTFALILRVVLVALAILTARIATAQMGNILPQDTMVWAIPTTEVDTIPVEVHTAFSVHAIALRSTINTYLLAMLPPDTERHVLYFYPTYSPHCGNNTGWGATGFCFNDSLWPGAVSDTAVMNVQLADTGNYFLRLTARYTTPLQTQEYVLHIHYSISNAVVSTNQNEPFDFSLSPNPAESFAMIGLPSQKSSTVEIYDILGNLVLTKEAVGEMTWSPKEASGSYIVRVIQRNDDGTVSSRSKRLVFVR